MPTDKEKPKLYWEDVELLTEREHDKYPVAAVRISRAEIGPEEYLYSYSVGAKLPTGEFHPRPHVQGRLLEDTITLLARAARDFPPPRRHRRDERGG